MTKTPTLMPCRHCGSPVVREAEKCPACAGAFPAKTAANSAFHTISIIGGCLIGLFFMAVVAGGC